MCRWYGFKLPNSAEPTEAATRSSQAICEAEGGLTAVPPDMNHDTIVDFSEIPVMFVAGDRSRPIPEQAPLASETLEAKLLSRKGRQFSGVTLGNEDRACAAIALTGNRRFSKALRWNAGLAQG